MGPRRPGWPGWAQDWTRLGSPEEEDALLGWPQGQGLQEQDPRGAHSHCPGGTKGCPSCSHSVPLKASACWLSDGWLNQALRSPYSMTQTRSEPLAVGQGEAEQRLS